MKHLIPPIKYFNENCNFTCKGQIILRGEIRYIRCNECLGFGVVWGTAVFLFATRGLMRPVPTA